MNGKVTILGYIPGGVIPVSSARLTQCSDTIPEEKQSLRSWRNLRIYHPTAYSHVVRAFSEEHTCKELEIGKIHT